MTQGSFRGNKGFLPSKPCAVCGKPMTWRKAWAKNWEQVKYCSERCRQFKTSPATSSPSTGDRS
ncbi:MAG: DUF2256 domain-containing protein [Burkholderiaceae bacterium]